jgi:hypothetical protein
VQKQRVDMRHAKALYVRMHAPTCFTHSLTPLTGRLACSMPQGWPALRKTKTMQPLMAPEKRAMRRCAHVSGAPTLGQLLRPTDGQDFVIDSYVDE